MGYDCPRISEAWWEASLLMDRPLSPAVFQTSKPWAAMQIPSLMTSVQMTATLARY